MNGTETQKTVEEAKSNPGTEIRTEFVSSHEAPEYGSPCVGCKNLRRGEDKAMYFKKGFLRICVALDPSLADTFRRFYEEAIPDCPFRTLG